MRKILKTLASVFLVPLTQWYLRKERKYTRRDTTVSVFPGVFHPGMFSSTNFILSYLEKQSLTNQSLLEIGSGTGLISVMAAKAGAKVMATDVSNTAIENTIANARTNHVSIDIVYSDLFDEVERRTFDWIIINPPYYARDPEKESDLAWYCGQNFEYFKKLFKSIPEFLTPQSNVIMVLTKNCDLQKIFSLGRDAGFDFVLIREKNAIFDGKDFLYRIQATASDKGGG